MIQKILVFSDSRNSYQSLLRFLGDLLDFFINIFQMIRKIVCIRSRAVPAAGYCFAVL